MVTTVTVPLQKPIASNVLCAGHCPRLLTFIFPATHSSDQWQGWLFVLFWFVSVWFGNTWD
jgi:hypothetical protein